MFQEHITATFDCHSSSKQTLFLLIRYHFPKLCLRIFTLIKNGGSIFHCLIQYLQEILATGDYDSSSVKIRHIICLNNTQTVTSSRQNYNLNSLKQIIPLYSNHYQYDCYYYYDNVDSVTNAFSLFPYAVITPKCSCLLTADMQSGLTTTDSESLRFFSCLYEQYWRNFSPLLHPSNNLYVQLEYAQGTIQPPNHSYSFQMLPCLTPFLTIEFLEIGRVGEYPPQYCNPFSLLVSKKGISCFQQQNKN